MAAKKKNHKRKKAAQKRAIRRKGRISPIILILVLVVAIISGYIFMENPDLWDSVTQIADGIFEADDQPAIILPVDGEMLVHFIDVGQGDAVLVQTAGGTVLIDGGDRHMGTRVADYLRHVGISEITYMIATHPHADHIGGLIEVLHQFPVNTLIMPPVAHTTITFERFLDAIEQSDATLREPVPGSTFSVGDAVFTIIAPNSTGHNNLNDYSVSLRLVHGSLAFVFTGDAYTSSEQEMIAAGHRLSANVLHLGHHGSSTSSGQQFLDAVNPEIAVISVAADNSYGHPHNAVMSRLRVAGVRIYRTDQHGNVVISSDGTNLAVHHD